MSKGNKIPDFKLKHIGLPDFDDFFGSAADPIKTVVGWNNGLDDIMGKLKGLAADIQRKKGDSTAQKEIGTAKLEVAEDGMITVKVMSLENPEEELTKLPKGTSERVKMVSKKAKMLAKTRLPALKKKGEEYANATFKLDPEDDTKVVLDCDTSAIEDEDVVVDLRRSLDKFNDRVTVLKGNLKGIPSLADAIKAIIQDAVDFVKEKSAKLAFTLKNGIPSFNLAGIPDPPESLADFFPDLIKKAWEALTKLIDFIGQLASEIPAMLDKVKELVEKAQEFPGKVKAAAGELNPPPGLKDILKMGKATKFNVAKVKDTPGILKTIGDTLKETTTSLVEAAESATGQKGE